MLAIVLHTKLQTLGPLIDRYTNCFQWHLTRGFHYAAPSNLPNWSADVDKGPLQAAIPLRIIQWI